jgi:hypothetical protein
MEMSMKLKFYPVAMAPLFISALIFSAHTHASDFGKAADKLCNKMTACIVQQISADDDLPPQMKEMAKNMAKNMCTSFYEFEEVIENTNLVDSSLACFDSLEALECSDLMDGFETPECKEFEKLTADYSN